MEAKKLREIDNKFTYIIGFRNVYNIAVLFVAAMGFLLYPATALIVIVLVVLGLKWFLTQVRENIDTVAINEITTSEMKESARSEASRVESR
jgi:hypothetical protein